jgi:hypothetical protein
MPRKPPTDPATMLTQVAEAIAKADGGDVQGDAGRYLRLAQAALKPLAKPTDNDRCGPCSGLVRRVLGDQQPQRLSKGGQGNDPCGAEGK